MSLLIDVDGDYCILTVGPEDKHLELNVIYALQNIPWFERRGDRYFFSWYDIILAKKLFTDLQFDVKVTAAALAKLEDWFRWIRESDSGIRLLVDTLKPFQHRDVLFCRPRSSAWIGHEQGVGKTHSGIAVAFDKLQRNMIDHVVVVCPGGVKKKWARTISKNIPPPFNSVVIVKDQDTEGLWAQKVYWHILTYAKAREEKDVVSSLFARHGNFWSKNLLIGDELHRAQHESRHQKGKGMVKVKQTDAVQQFARWSVGTIALTGQKIHALDRLFTIMESVDPMFFRSWEEFSQRYISYDVMIRGKVLATMKENEISEKMPMIKVSYSRADVYEDLKPIEFEDRIVELSERERKLYKDYVTQGFFEQGTEHVDRRGMVQNSLTIMTAARRFLGCPALINKSWPKESSKMKEMKMLLEGNDQKVVIFSQWAEICDLIVEELGCENCMLYTRNAKDELWRDYLMQDQKKYFVMNTRGKEAIELHGMEDPETKQWRYGASVLIQFDELADPSDNEQVCGRISRYIDNSEIMKKHRATVFRLRCENTCEEHIVDLQEQRLDFARRLAKNQLSYQELRRLMFGEEK